MHWTTDKIRQSFLDFFKDRGHQIVPSASLVPKGDPTLLFTNAGMVPFKDYFLGIRTPAAARVADCQKCLRISGKHNDLEAVGRDSYHHTFFEMLGNWSFGDYYKREAIEFHWKLINEVWGIAADRLWATVYKDDDEAEQAWLELGYLPRERVLRCGEKDNFWEMGETGPCGPCSEIHIDRGAAACDRSGHADAGEACAVNVEGCSRFIELANLVFIQYNRDASGKLTPLPMKHVDTGTGLERVASVLQSLEESKRLGKEVVLGNYDIDVFKTIIKAIEETSSGAEIKTGIGPTPLPSRYPSSSETDISFRAIADHARAISFLIAEGQNPGNTDREYVLRRLIRRAARHGRYLGIKRPFLARVCEGVREAMGKAYDELNTQAARIQNIVTQEEERFGETLDRGLELIEAEGKRLKQANAGTLSGEVAFRLYDTYGFPLDLTQDEMRRRGYEVDVAGFERLMEEQRERGRAARKDDAIAPEIKLDAGAASRFIGHHRYDAESEILAAHRDDDNRVILVTAETPFYPEGGGQIGDRGVIESATGALLEVVDTRKADGSILHVGRLLRGDPGDFDRGRRVTLSVDRARRDAAMLNHSATHILHYALRDVLGTGVHQAGSLVAPDRLRFDFAHTGPVGEGDLATIEEEINARIRENAEVATEEMAYDDALKAGALAFFGDKYGDVVRVVRMGDFSVELCGGTHVSRTGDIGLFKFEAESGVAAGVRRIEAATGQGALEAIRRRERILEAIGGHLGARDDAAVERLERLLAREKELEKKLRALEQKLVAGDGAAGGVEAEKVHQAGGGVKVVTRRLEGVDPRALREMADRMRQKYGSAVVAIGSVVDGKVAILVAVTADLTSRIKAGDIVKQIAPIVGGTGGGRPDFAQAGGRDPSRLDEALERVTALVA
ncbi:MAG TPA: alanine--tRNA ligase [Candidatus Binataceae bacterium]|jgi:alanyl-tRNA synthetase|nr:alanine--tRNA ligase [Candidatus Binataceae bacterium]